MKSCLVPAFLLLLLNGNVFAKSCEIIVHEKTPDSYVKQNEYGCLDIGNTKPDCNDKGECIAKLPGCDAVRRY